MCKKALLSATPQLLKRTVSAALKTKKMANQGSIKLGPWGGSGGTARDFTSGNNPVIKEIVINHGDVVDSITFTSVERANGGIIGTIIYGGTGGKADTISINLSRGEYLTSISGTTTNFNGMNVIQSLTFYTNQSKFGPYGKTNGSAFEIPMEKGEIVGFFGRAGSYLDALGIYVKPSSK